MYQMDRTDPGKMDSIRPHFTPRVPSDLIRSLSYSPCGCACDEREREGESKYFVVRADDLFNKQQKYQILLVL